MTSVHQLKVKALHPPTVCDPSVSVFGKTTLGRIEGTLHEVAHGVTLGLTGEQAYHSVYIGDCINAMLESGGYQAHDWNEIKTQAVAIVALRKLGFAPSVKKLAKYAMPNMLRVTDAYAYTSIQKLIPARTTARHARKVLEIVGAW